jgi:hypothetical protein
MYPSKHARELAILLRISRELDIVGDVSATVDNPSELLAWATILTDPTVAAWRAQDSGQRYIQVTADHARAPVRGRVTAVLPCEQHTEFWHALTLDQVSPGDTRTLSIAEPHRSVVRPAHHPTRRRHAGAHSTRNHRPVPSQLDAARPASTPAALIDSEEPGPHHRPRTVSSA